MTLPNFFIAGAPKAGTDLLFYQLEQHPQIYMSPLKEPNFFAEEVRPERFHPSLREHAEAQKTSTQNYLDAAHRGKRFGGIITSLEEYASLFRDAEGHTAIGEGSVCYLWSKTAAAAIARLIPQARIILTLMDPSTRAFHQYLKSFSDKAVSHSFSHHLDLAFDDRIGDQPQDQIRIYNPLLALGEYAGQIERFIDSFPKEQLFISLYEDSQEDYALWFADLLHFLEVDSGFMLSEVNVPSTPHFTADNPRPILLPEDRARLVSFYCNDILRLEEIIDRDLSGWLI